MVSKKLLDYQRSFVCSQEYYRINSKKQSIIYINSFFSRQLCNTAKYGWIIIHPIATSFKARKFARVLWDNALTLTVHICCYRIATTSFSWLRLRAFSRNSFYDQNQLSRCKSASVNKPGEYVYSKPHHVLAFFTAWVIRIRANTLFVIRMS